MRALCWVTVDVRWPALCKPSSSRRLGFPMDTEGVTVRVVLFMKSMLVMLEKMYSSLNCDSVRGQRLTFSFGGRG